MRKSIWIAIQLAIILGLASSPGRAFAEDSLGVSLQVIQGSSDASANLANNNNLWFISPPGKSVSRSFNLRSASNIAQRVTLSVSARRTVNGNLELDSDSVSPVNEWTTFSKQSFFLGPHAIQTVTMTIKVPADAEVNVYTPALLVQVRSANKSTSQYKVPNALRLVQGMFVGAGTTAEMSPAFSIDDVYGGTTTAGHELIVDLKNTGKTPLQLTGSLQLSNATFDGPVQGPYNFFTDVIPVGETGHAYIPVDSRITEDKWKIFADVKQGGIEVTKTFVKDIRFNTDNTMLIAIASSAAVILGLAIALISIYTLRRLRTKRQLELEMEQKRVADREAELERIAQLEAQLAKLQKPTRTRKTKKPPVD